MSRRISHIQTQTIHTLLLRDPLVNPANPDMGMNTIRSLAGKRSCESRFKVSRAATVVRWKSQGLARQQYQYLLRATDVSTLRMEMTRFTLSSSQYILSVWHVDLWRPHWGLL